MIVRVVKLKLKTETRSEFISLFENYKPMIRAFDGCSYVSLHHEDQDPNLLFTISHWESVDHLEGYRNSATFKGIWSQMTPLFGGRPEAFSLEKIAEEL